MPATIRIPTPLRPLAGGKSEVPVEATTVKDALENLEGVAAGIGARIFDDKGALRRFVNVYLNDEDVRHLDGLNSAVSDGDLLSIVPAIAGGIPSA